MNDKIKDNATGNMETLGVSFNVPLIPIPISFYNKDKKFTDIVPQTAKNYSHDVTTLESRLKAKICEVCGCTENDRYEIHHVNKVKNLKGKSEWEKIMIAKRRKTIVVCHKCHMAIHHGEKK